MIVHWTHTALQQLQAIHDYIAQNPTEYARRMVERLIRRSEQIATFPLSGRAVPEYEVPQVREGVEGAYRILYHVKPDQVDVVAVIHGAQDLN